MECGEMMGRLTGSRVGMVVLLVATVICVFLVQVASAVGGVVVLAGPGAEQWQ